MERRLVSKSELMEMWGISLTSINRMMKRKKVPYVKLGRSVRFDMVKLEELLEKKTVNKKAA